MHQTVHIVRHGEVWNPGNIVYAGLDGFGLSELGQRQAVAAATQLSTKPVTRVVSSPLQRAVETAIPIAGNHGVRVETDERLLEWELMTRWAGNPWSDLPVIFPGEVEAYLVDPLSLPFAPESITQLGARISGAVKAIANDGAEHLVVVCHQDPIHVATRMLTGQSLEPFHTGKPDHASVTSLDPATDPWTYLERWTPTQV